MNWLDFSLVLMAIVDAWIIPFVGVSVDLRMMSVLRMLRLVRLARLLRLFRVFKELTLLVTGFVNSVRHLFWALVFLMTVVFSFALVAKQFIGSAKDCAHAEMNDEDCPDMFTFPDIPVDQNTLFGSVHRTMITLFVCLSEGCAANVIQPIVLKRPEMIIFWMCFVFVTTFGLLNVIVGCFCENALSTASQNEFDLVKQRDLYREKRLQELREVFLADRKSVV